MKRILSAQALMSDGKIVYSGLFDEDGNPVEIELECESGCTMMSVIADVDDEDYEDECLCENCRRERYETLTESEIDEICRGFSNCEDCPLNDYCGGEDEE